MITIVPWSFLLFHSPSSSFEFETASPTILCKFLSLLSSRKTKPGLQCFFSMYPGMCFKGQKLRIAVHSIWECELSLVHLAAQTVPPSMRPHTTEGRASSFCPSLTRRSARSSHPVSPLALQLHAIFLNLPVGRGKYTPFPVLPKLGPFYLPSCTTSLRMPWRQP